MSPLTVISGSLPDLPVQARTLGFLLREVYAVLQQRIYDEVAAAGHPGLRAMHSAVLRHLSPEGGRVADVARASGLAKQSVTYVVEDLVALGYLRSEPDPADGRARRLVYTARGKKLLAALLTASGEAETSLASLLGPQRLRALRESLETILEEPPAEARPERITRPKSRGGAERRRGRDV